MTYFPNKFSDALLKNISLGTGAVPDQSIGELRGRHRGQSIAILGSGPSLSRFSGKQDIVIAVNGGAFSPFRYQYFVCGDQIAPKRSWFHQSKKFDATRIISSFLAPFDPFLYPQVNDRVALPSNSVFLKPVLARALSTLYSYSPALPPEKPHLLFQYERLPLVCYAEAPFNPNSQRFFHGATISGVALQLAVLMGAAEVNLYGVDFDNVTGLDYHHPTSEQGKISTNLQRESFAKLELMAARYDVKIYRPGA